MTLCHCVTLNKLRWILFLPYFDFCSSHSMFFFNLVSFSSSSHVLYSKLRQLPLNAASVPLSLRVFGEQCIIKDRNLSTNMRTKIPKSSPAFILSSEEAWELFRNKVGYNTLSRDPVIVQLARKVAEKCRGLPLALCVIGETMASKTTVQEWEHAIDVLNTSAGEL